MEKTKKQLAHLKWMNNNPAKYKESKHKYRNKRKNDIKNLADWYIKVLLKSEGYTEITPLQMKIKRETLIEKRNGR